MTLGSEPNTSTGRRRLRRALVAMAVLVVLAIVGTVALRTPAGRGGDASTGVRLPPGAPVAEKPVFAASGLEGGGFQSVLATDPFDRDVVLAGADVAGVARSSDGGRTWVRSNRGLAEPAAQHVAAIVFSPVHRDLVYLAAGKQGGGGLYVSADGGRSWSKRSAVPRFEGGRLPQEVQAEPHPRSTGVLLAVDPRGGELYAGTFASGLLRSTDDGRNWQVLGLAGKHIRGIALDPDHPDTMYVGTSGDGVFATRSARTDGTFVALAGSPRRAEELRVVSDTVYVAGNTDGVFAGSGGGRNWTRLGGRTLPNGPVWVSVAATRVGGGTVVYAGSAFPADTGASVVRSTDGGRTFRTFLGGEGLRNQVGGPGGPPWWLLSSEQRMMPGRNGYIASHVEVDPSDGRRVLVAGRAGVWGTTDGGGNWYPLVRGLNVTITIDAVGDPNVPGRVYVTLFDWTMVSSTDDLRTVTRTRPPDAGSVGWSIALDAATTPSTVFLGAGNARVNEEGEVYSSPDPLKGKWTPTGLAAASGGGRPRGLAVGHDGSTRVLLAAVQGAGLWRKAGSDAWEKILPDVAANAVPVPLVWLPGDRHAYLYDARRGLLRSDDAGRTWRPIWRQGERSGRATFAVDPKQPDRGYLSSSDGLFALSGLTGSPRARRLAGVERPGPVAVDARGSLFVAERTGRAPDMAQLLRSNDEGVHFELAGDPVYAASAVSPNKLVVTRDGKLIVTLQGTGALVAR